MRNYKSYSKTLKSASVALLLGLNLSYANFLCSDFQEFKQFNGHFYALSAKRMSFDEARALASKSSSYLAVPNSESENDFLKSLINLGNAFIGVYDASKTSNYCTQGQSGCVYDDSRFQSINGSSLSYKNWATNQPDNQIIKDSNSSNLGQHIVVMSSSSGKWSDENDDLKSYALFEFDSMPECFSGGVNQEEELKETTTFRAKINADAELQGASDIENTDTPVGTRDAKNDGWNADGSCTGNILIFNGKDNRCKSWDRFGGLAGGGCCDKDKVFLGLVACSEEEKKLAKQNKDGKCHEVGEYCSKKVSLGFKKICVQRKKSVCCFSSKLGRIFNEQGRKQIFRGWGRAESPDCRGFTPEEFQKLDFSEIDLSEFIADILGSVNIGQIKADSLKIQERIERNVQNTQPKK